MSESKKTRVESKTPPWTYFVGNANGRGLVRIETAAEADEAGVHIASMPRGKQNEMVAERIVYAVNSYSRHFGPDAVAAAEDDVLGAALEALRDELNTLEEIAADHQGNKGPRDGTWQSLDRRMSNIRAVLARVPKESQQ